MEWAISDPITRQSVLDLIPVRHLLILQCDMQNVDIFNVIFKMLAESKQKGQTRSIRMEDFLSWGQFFT